MYKHILSQTVLHVTKSLTLSSLSSGRSITYFRQIHYAVCLWNPRHTPKPNIKTSPAIASKYQVITEENSPVIEHTVDEVHSDTKYTILSDEFDGINLESMYIF